MSKPIMTRVELTKAAAWMRAVGRERLNAAARYIEEEGSCSWPLAQGKIYEGASLLKAAQLLEGCAENTDN